MGKELILTVVIRKEGTRYSALCPELDVASDGDSIEEARANLKEAVELYIETISSDGKLDDLLEQLGIQPEQLEKKVLVSEIISGSFGIELPA